jgi:hypothetical protein
MSKRLGLAVTGIVTAIQSGAEPVHIAVSVASIICTYIAAETIRPSGVCDGNGTSCK